MNKNVCDYIELCEIGHKPIEIIIGNDVLYIGSNTDGELAKRLIGEERMKWFATHTPLTVDRYIDKIVFKYRRPKNVTEKY